MMRDKLVKASFPASLGKALAVRTHHRSRCQHLLCCKLKLETFQLNICVFGDRPAVISVKKWKKLQQHSAWDQFPHIYKYPRLAQQRLLNFSTRAGRGVRRVDPLIFVCDFDFDYDFLSDETKCALTLVL